VQRLTSYDLSVIARGHVAGRSDAVIGARLDPPRDRSTVRKARARPVVQTMIRDERRRQSSAARSAAYRQRKKEKEEQAEKLERGYAAYPPDSLARGNQNRYPHISETGYLITSNVWYPPLAARPVPITCATRNHRRANSKLIRVSGRATSTPNSPATRSGMCPKIRNSCGSSSRRASLTNTTAVRPLASAPFEPSRLTSFSPPERHAHECVDHGHRHGAVQGC
jgi:hypothetical protein